MSRLHARRHPQFSETRLILGGHELHVNQLMPTISLAVDLLGVFQSIQSDAVAPVSDGVNEELMTRRVEPRHQSPEGIGWIWPVLPVEETDPKCALGCGSIVEALKFHNGVRKASGG